MSQPPPARAFPPDFTWGVATSSYQIEGAATADGRGPSIWDTFCRTPGKVLRGDTGDVACDHYHRWPEDIALMRELGVSAYRLSVAWPRVLPQGTGAANPAGLDFYERLVDGLLEACITPWLTLYHWDLPQPLQDQGGWPSRQTVDAFVAYADVLTRRLGDRVKHWITINEPWVIAYLGHLTGEHAPGLTDGEAMLRAAHHVLLAHGRAVPVIGDNSPDARVGITLNLVPAEAASPSRADREATRHFDGMFNRWYLDPLHGRGYPRDIVRDWHMRGFLPTGRMPFVHRGDLEEIAVPTDFLGVNFYNRAIVRDESVPEADRAPATVHHSGHETDMGWEVHAPPLTGLLLRLHREYAAGPLYITENGCAYADGPGPDGVVRDTRRIDYYRQHLAACHAAIRQGAPLHGYFAWSLLDNFEWAFGYERRFGLVHVDFETQRRTPKQSARWYRDVIARGELDRA